MAIVAVSISPVGTGEASLGRYVAAALRVLDEEGLKYRLDPMFTTIEGDLDRIFAAIRKMQEAVFSEGAVRVSTVIKIDDRRDRQVSMEDKVDSVERRLR